MRSPEELTQIFRATARKITPQRHSTVHPTAEAVYETVRAEMPSISLRTVYQTLHDLADLGHIHAIDLGTGSGRFDPNTRPHHHLVCVSCGWVQDVEADFPQVTAPPASHAGFEVTATEIVFPWPLPLVRRARHG